MGPTVLLQQLVWGWRGLAFGETCDKKRDGFVFSRLQVACLLDLLLRSGGRFDALYPPPPPADLCRCLVADFTPAHPFPCLLGRRWRVCLISPSAKVGVPPSKPSLSKATRPFLPFLLLLFCPAAPFIAILHSPLPPAPSAPRLLVCSTSPLVEVGAPLSKL
jgi:hypothetical protein